MSGRWTDAEHDRLYELWQQGRSDEQIASCLNRSTQAVSQRRWMLGFTYDQVQPPPPSSWSAADLAALKDLWLQGQQDRTIAAALGRTVAAVKRKRADQGWVQDPPLHEQLQTQRDYSAQLQMLRAENAARTRDAMPPRATWTPGEPSPEARPLRRRSRQRRARA